MSKEKLHILCLLLFISCSVRAQVIDFPQQQDSVDIVFYAKKNAWEAGLQNFSLNMGIWGFNRFIMNESFARINIHTIKKNLSHPFVWDNDMMSTNMFAHPYHGNLYFNSARSQGFNYWKSGLFAFGGSAMWELFLENEYPSFNDIIATPIGGMALGEVLYRTSDLVFDDRQSGLPRLGRELAGFLIAPTRGLTRLLNGDAWRVRATSGRQFGTPDISVEVSAGVRALELKGEIFDEGVGTATYIGIEYGDRFADENEKPYDYFTLRSNVNIQNSQPGLGQLNILGRLYVRELADTKNHFLSLGFYQHFDYYDSDTISDISTEIPYKFCTPASIGIGFIYRLKSAKNVHFDAFIHANTILLGGALSDYYEIDDRNYNLASGFSAKAGFNTNYKDKISLSGNYEIYRMYTWKGYPQDIDWNNIDIREFNYQGDLSNAILYTSSLKMDIRLTKILFLTGMICNYTRYTNYSYFDNVFSHTWEGKFMITCKL
ncbi:MAG: DUF3943 domain-containing protein [Candidatus Symbiothrix sp.]|jgi:hypothetical protein|nr:DUF3943 domain-containing protein [Candidatus Symbiothrix sp.]